MLPYLIAGAIGFGIGKLFEEGGETFGRGGMTNEDILRSFLTSNRETQTNNLSTHYNQYDDFLLLRNYSTLIAIRKGNDVKITNIKYSNTTSTITNRLKALAEEMGYNVSYVSKFEEGGETFRRGGRTPKKVIKVRARGGYSLEDFFPLFEVYNEVVSYKKVGKLELQQIIGKKDVSDEFKFKTEADRDYWFEILNKEQEKYFTVQNKKKYVKYVLDNFGNYSEEAEDNDLKTLSEKLDYFADDLDYDLRLNTTREDFIYYLDLDVKDNYAGGGEAGKSMRDNYDALIGKVGIEYYFLDEIFKYKDGFKGATGTIVMPVSKQYYDYATSEEGILERYMDAMGEYEWLEVLGLDRDDFEDEDEMIKAIEDGIYDLYRVGELNPFEEVSYELEEQMRELPEFSDSDEYPLFEIIGGGRIFDKNRKFDKIYNQELFNKIKEIEEFAEGGKAGNKKQNKEEKRFSVWVGGEEVNDYYLTEEEAKNLAFEYEDDGYDDVVIADKDEYAEGGEAKKRRRRANTQTGRTDKSVDKTRVGKPVGYRFSNSLASKLRKDQYAVPTEKQITKYLGKGIYKENRKNRSDKDKIAKL